MAEEALQDVRDENRNQQSDTIIPNNQEDNDNNTNENQNENINEKK